MLNLKDFELWSVISEGLCGFREAAKQVITSFIELIVITSRSLSKREAEIRNRPSSSGISLFSNKLFKTGNTLRSAFSIPSRIRIRPLSAARTAA